MTSSELRGLNAEALSKQLDELYQTLFNMRFQRASGQLPDTNKLLQIRRDIARVKTIQRERELVAQRGSVHAAARRKAG